MDIEEKLDLAWLVKYKLEDMDTARTQRLAALAVAEAASREAKRIKGEKQRQEHNERLRAILVKHPTRWAVSIDGKLVVADKKTVRFECPKCGAELSQILDSLAWAMEHTYEKLWASDFSSGTSIPSTINSDTMCPCGKRSVFRVIPIPY